MAVPIIMPRQGQSVESCIISKWHKKKGEVVKKGDLLFTYETDKATFDEESSVDGTLLEIFFGEGDDVTVLTNVCVIGEEGEDTSQFRPDDEEQAGVAEPREDEVKSEGEEAGRETVVEGDTADNSSGDRAEDTDISGINKEAGKSGISPRAKSLAVRLGVDLSGAQGTGPQGRIIEKDIRRLWDEGKIATKAVSGQSEAGISIIGTGIGGRITTSDIKKAREKAVDGTETFDAGFRDGESPGVDTGGYEDIKLPHIRKVIAKTMHQSLMSTAQLTMSSSFDATAILELRKRIKAQGSDMGLSNVTLNDMILYAVSRVLPDFKELNAHFSGEAIRVFRNVNLGVAVNTDRGLMVPTIFEANKKSLNCISIEAGNLAERCRNNTIQPDELKGGSFTVTNLGVLGIESFTPILNPPQTGILGVNTITQRIKDTGEEICNYPAMGLSLTIDHRAVDGAPAARFLKTLAGSLENIELLLLS